MRTLATTPRSDGFRMPGEFEPHRASWMIWPERGDIWRGRARPAQDVFARIASALSYFEPVTMCVSGEEWVHARSVLPDRVRVVELSTNDAWMRDTGPMFVVNDAGDVRGVDWEFNAWGGIEEGCFFPWDRDNLIAEKVLELEGLDRYKSHSVLEGGSVHVDGEGTLITTEECLLNPNRNPQLSRGDVERLLSEFLGIDRIIWLPKGLKGDGDNNGHVDDLCCFVRPGVVALTWTEDPRDPQYDITRDAYERLSVSTDALGRTFEIHKINVPGPQTYTRSEVEGLLPVDGTVARIEGERMAASYINFYVANGAVLLPAFADPQDSVAAGQIAELFPDRTVVQLFTREVLLAVGNIHCIVMQQPKPKTEGSK